MDHEEDTNLNPDERNGTKNKSKIKAYKRRWIILFIFVFYASINAFQWVEYAIITNIVMRYYNVSAVTVDWTSILYLVLYLPLVIPASFLIDKKGLRVAALVGGLGTALGTAIKVFSIGRNLFYVVLIGQTILAASQLLILCLPPRLAAVWFKPNEVSTTCSLGVFGTQLGCALGFVLPPIIVKNHYNPEYIGRGFKILCWGLTAFVIPGALAVIFYFPKEPPNPPSITQARERNSEEKFSSSGFFKSIRDIFTNLPFVLHVIACAINIGVFSAISTLLNQFVLYYFRNAEEDVGRMGLLMIVMGIVGSVALGIFLDKTHKYKETALVIYILSTLSIVAVMFSLEMKSKILVYISIGIFGLFTSPYMPVGFELGTELTFPSPESTTTGLLMAWSQFFGAIFTLALGKLNSIVGPFWALGSQAVLLLIGSIMTAFIPNKLKRQAAFKDKREIDFQPVPISD